jgi:uncharacterized protein (DUF1499 family)
VAEMTASAQSAAGTGRRIALALAYVGLVAAAICATTDLLAGLGYRWGWWHYRYGIALLRVSGWSALAATAVALIGSVAAGMTGERRALAAGIAGVIVGALALGFPGYHYYQAQHLPRIHDISTDTDNPPRFVAALPLRRGAENKVDYSVDTAAEQKKGYPDIAPAVLQVSPVVAFERALAAARAMGWMIVASVPQEGRIEAVATTLLFGFKDDVVIRIAPLGSGSRIDLRSLSRVGRSDIGTNAKRVRAFLHELTAKG